MNVAVSADVVRVTLPDGAVVPFSLNEDGELGFDGRRRLKLATLGDGWELTKECGCIWWFDSNGVLLGGQDQKATFVVERFDDRVTLTEELSSRSVTYFLGRDGLVTRAETSDGRKASYTYEDGHCVGVESDEGSFRYEIVDELVAAIVDVDGVALCRNTYDSESRVVSQLSPFGRLTDYEYLPNEMTRITDNTGGPANLFQHDKRGNLIALYGGDGKALKMEWDHLDRNTKVVDRSNHVTAYTFDPEQDVLVGRTDPDGLSEVREYDDADRMVKRIGRSNEVHTYSYETDFPTPTRLVGPNGGVAVVELTEIGLPAKVVDPDGVATTFGWDSDGQLLSITNAAGKSILYTYDLAGRLVGVADSAGHATTFSIDDRGQIGLSLGVDGTEKSYEYSPAGRLTRYRVQDGPGSFALTYGAHGEVETAIDSVGKVTTFGYNLLGQRTSTTHPDGLVSEREFDELGQVVAIIDQAGNRWSQKYDANGVVIETTDPNGTTSRRTVDDAGRTLTATGPDGAVVSSSYHPDGSIASAVLPAGDTFNYEVDLSGRLVAKVAPNGDKETFDYSPAGRLLKRTTAAGRVTTLSYDSAGMLVSVVDPNGVEVTGEYNEDGTVRRLHQSGASVEYLSDDVGRFVGVSTSGTGDSQKLVRTPFGLNVERESGSITFNYGLDRSLSSVSDPAGVVTRFETDSASRSRRSITGDRMLVGDLDEVGRLVGLSYGDALTVALEYSASGLLERYVSGESVAIDLSYDLAGRVVGLSGAAESDNVSFSYGPSGKLVQAENGAGVVRRSVDVYGSVLSCQHLSGVTSTFERDADGYVVSTQTGGGPSIDLNRDVGGRLVGFSDESNELVALAEAQRLERDGDGRILVDQAGRIHCYDYAGRLASTVAASGDRYEFTYDESGLLDTDISPMFGRRIFVYNQVGQLVRVESDAGEVTDFLYDSAGRRVGAQSDDGSSVEYRWNSFSHLTSIVSTDSSGSVSVRSVTYSGFGRPEYVDDIEIGWDDAISGKPVKVGADYFVRFGTKVRKWDASGVWSDGLVDDPWGHDNVAGVRLGFEGELMVDGLVFMGDRVYDPATRTFLSRDPLPPTAGANGFVGYYAYAWNDPINFLDPTGRGPVSRQDFGGWTERQQASRWDTEVNRFKTGTGDAWDWTTDTASDAWGWTSDTAGDAWDFTSDKAQWIAEEWWDRSSTWGVYVWDTTKRRATNPVQTLVDFHTGTALLEDVVAFGSIVGFDGELYREGEYCGKEFSCITGVPQPQGAITLGHSVLFKQGGVPPAHLIAHEAQHVYDVEDVGGTNFYGFVLGEYAVRGLLKPFTGGDIYGRGNIVEQRPYEIEDSLENKDSHDDLEPEHRFRPDWDPRNLDLGDLF